MEKDLNHIRKFLTDTTFTGDDDEQIPDISTAIRSYNFGTQEYESESFDRFVEFITAINANDGVLPESTPSRVLIHENTKDLSTWALDERSVSFQGGMNENGEPVSPADLGNLEKMIRENFTETDMEAYFIQLLMTGVSYISVGMDDTVYIPQSVNCKSSHGSDMHIAMLRQLTGEEMKTIVLDWVRDELNMVDPDYGYDGPSMMEFAQSPEADLIQEQIDDIKMRMEDVEDLVDEISYDVTYGQYETVDGEFIEYVRRNDVLHWRKIPHRVIFKQVFSVDDNMRPVGVYGLIQNEEKMIIYLQHARRTRANEAIRAAAFVRNLGGDAADGVTDVYGNGLVLGVPADITQNERDIVQFAPNRMNEIPDFNVYIDKLYQRCRQLTGLYERPQVVSASNTSATEAMLVYNAQTNAHRTIMGVFTKIFGKMVKALAMRDYGVELECEVVSNPLDETLRQTGIKEMIPVVIDSMKNDPKGELLGGLFNEKTLQGMMIDLFDSYKISRKYLGDPTRTRMSDQESMEEGKEEDANAALIIAKAEEKKADVQVAELEIKKAEVNLKDKDIERRAQEHKDNNIIRIIELQMEAKMAKKEALANGDTQTAAQLDDFVNIVNETQPTAKALSMGEKEGETE